MKKTLIVLEGLDGSGKSTQINELCSFFESSGVNFKKIKLPNYSSGSSQLVKMYLSGDFGDDASKVNPYAASLFYAVDRFASFNTEWRTDYESGKIILADRYATSNVIYQMSKLPCEEWGNFLEWLEDTEFKKLALPEPDLTIFLDISPSISQKLLSSRYHGDEMCKDIHEKNVDFLERSRSAALFAAAELNWTVIDCCDGNGSIKNVDEIKNEIKNIVENFLNNRR